MDRLNEFYHDMLLIRSFEQKLKVLFSEGRLFGTTHTYIGQEANAVGVISNLRPDDIVVGNHRSHGHYLAFKKNAYALFCEIMGKSDGLCGGRGGSQHLCDGNFFTNGIQGGIVALAAGLAFSRKIKKTSDIVTVFLGDGTFGEGLVYEGLNVASKWKLPLLFVVENNRYAQSTSITKTLAGTFAARFEAFDIPHKELSTFDVREISETSGQCVAMVREESRPFGLILNTYRFSSHSNSDDGRDKNEIEEWRKKDCIPLLAAVLDKKTRSEIERKVENEIESAVSKALTSSDAEPDGLQEISRSGQRGMERS